MTLKPKAGLARAGVWSPLQLLRASPECLLYTAAPVPPLHTGSSNPRQPGGVAVLTLPFPGEDHDSFKTTRLVPAPRASRAPDPRLR